jgi:hypothetical protein
VTGRTALVRAELRLRQDGRSGDPLALLEWSPPGTATQNDRWRCAPPVAACEFIVANATGCDARRLEIADAIVCADESPPDRPSVLLRETLRRYPGCAVATVGLGGCELLARTRAGTSVTFSVDRGESQAGSCAVLCASFIQGWLAAGHPFTALDPARLRVVACTPSARLESQFRDAVISLSFGIC